MPVIKSAKKRMKQSEKRRERNYPVRSSMKTHIKKILLAVKAGQKDEAEKLMPHAYKNIDTAAKKNIIHENNAARKKSRLAKALANIGKEKPVKQAKKAKKTVKKVETAKKEEVAEVKEAKKEEKA